VRAALIVALLMAMFPAMAADEPAVAVERVKAAFLYKFAAYVEWPTGAFQQADSPLVIGVAGADDIAAELEQVAVGRNVSGRPVQVHRLARAENAGSCCQILFIGARNERAHVRELLGSAQGHPVLTVTDTDAEHPKGSIINFLEATDRVRFDISRNAAERNGLQLRSQLLAVARQVSQ
jgi:YfiR/HmsC-like